MKFNTNQRFKISSMSLLMCALLMLAGLSSCGNSKRDKHSRKSEHLDISSVIDKLGFSEFAHSNRAGGAPTVDERWAGFTKGGVKSSVCYRAESANMSLSEAKRVAGRDGGFNSVEFTEDGKIAKYSTLTFTYDGDRLVNIDSHAGEVTVNKSSSGQILELNSVDDMSDQTFMFSYKYNQYGDLVWNEDRYWEFVITTDYEYDDNHECISSKDCYWPDYESEVIEQSRYTILERDRYGNWIKQAIKTQIDTNSFVMGDEANGTHTYSEEEGVVFREVEYY